MAKHLDPRTLLKKISVPLLQQFFQRQGVLLDLHWDELKAKRQVDPICDAWQRLPDARRRQVQTTLQDLAELSDHRGMKVFAEEVKRCDPDRVWQFAACRTRPNKAMWFFLNFREQFEQAALLARADALSQGRYAVRRIGLPKVPIDATSRMKQSLETTLCNHYWPNEMRGEHCHVEHHTRDKGHEYFFAYLDDWPDTRLVFEDSGELSPKSERYAFSVLFIFCSHDGSLDVVAKGGAEIYYPLQQAFCRAVFDMPIEPADPLRPEYQLQQVLDPAFKYPTETTDGIARVRLSRIRLATNNNTFPVQTFDLQFRRAVTRPQWLNVIHHDLEAHELRVNQIVVQQATFQLIFIKNGFARTKTMTFTVSVPSRCNLKEKSDEDREVGERCLNLWGMSNA